MKLNTVSLLISLPLDRKLGGFVLPQMSMNEKAAEIEKER